MLMRVTLSIAAHIHYRDTESRTQVRRFSPILVAALLVFVAADTWSGPAFDQGSELLLENKPEQAVTYLEQAVREEPSNLEAYLYLSLVYEQLGLHTEAISTLSRAMDVPGAKLHVLYFNIGNNYVHQEDLEHAIESYTMAIDANRTYPKAYLNRANLLVQTESYQAAVDDYRVYLNLEPNSPQRPAIERAISLLEDTIEQERIRAEEERRRREEEERRRREEEERRRLEEERRRREEEERRKALLDSVLNSLQSASEETENMSAGNEDIEVEVEDDLDIAD